MLIRQKTFDNKDGTARTYLQLIDKAADVRHGLVSTLGWLKDRQDKLLDTLIENLAHFPSSFVYV
ncbi:hypothetical protein [Thermaerobacter marianensis]|uniref:hypothetical protein n=1 Tax=Thermaerobacter marianensis TaxID=73919 RepID=UPI0002D3B7E7|nr:hypothetical protein [Thermaerobacter marianensis]